MAQQGRRDHRLLAAEVERLRRNCAETGSTFELGARWNELRTEVDYLYRMHHLICDEINLDEVLDALGDNPPTAVLDGPVGLKVLDIGDRDAADLADALAASLGTQVVTPNHVLDSQGHSRMCPATEPVPWYGPIKDLGEPSGQGRSRIAVIDTGYLPSVAQASNYARFSAVDQNSQPDDEVFAGTTTIRPYGGHGTAATACLLSVSGANSVQVHVRDCLVGGGVDEITIVEDLETVIGQGVDIISIQAGLYTGAGSSLAFDAFYQRLLRKHPGIVLVVAAGNDGSDRPFWPAAYEWCTAVGALTHGGDAHTGWTNFGHWVDVYATGENIVVPFPDGTYDYLDGFSAEFTQAHAIWSGTSFATPFVAGMIARRMVERNVDAPTARDIVLAEAATNALPDTGPRVLI